MTPLPAAIRAERVKRGLSQRELGERLGVRQTAISHLALGRNAPRLPHFAALIRELELDATEVLS